MSSWSLTRDSTGRITRRSETVGASSAVYDYLYDANGRLLKVLKDSVPAEEYAYDENGARIFEMNTLRGITSRSYEYSDEDHLVKAGEWVYQYDADGFLTSKTNSTNPTNKTLYFYSSRGELLTVILPDGKRIDYVCDPLGRRIAKKVTGATVEKYLWQGMTRLLAVHDGNNSLLMRLEHADDRMPVAARIGGATYYLSYDQVGSLRVVADASGSVVKRISYDSFGNILEDTNPSFAVPFGFAGGLRDRDTGLVRFGYRDYDPEVGRWTAKDPIGFAGGDTDLYSYVLNDPVNDVDPEGLWTFSLGVFINVAIGIGGGGGLELNFGYSDSAGFSISLAGTAQAGAIAGASAFVGGGISVTNACSVNQLNGTSYQFGRAGFGIGPSFAVEGVMGSGYYGSTFYGGIGPGYTANSLTVSTTSAIIQYDNGTLSLGNAGASSIWSNKLY